MTSCPMEVSFARGPFSSLCGCIDIEFLNRLDVCVGASIWVRNHFHACVCVHPYGVRAPFHACVGASIWGFGAQAFLATNAHALLGTDLSSCTGVRMRRGRCIPSYSHIYHMLAHIINLPGKARFQIVYISATINSPLRRALVKWAPNAKVYARSTNHRPAGTNDSPSGCASRTKGVIMN